MRSRYNLKQFKKTYVDQDVGIIATICWYPESPERWVVRTSVKKGPTPEWHIEDKGDWITAEFHVEALLRKQGYHYTDIAMFTKTRMIVMVFEGDPDKGYEKQNVFDTARVYVPLLPIRIENTRKQVEEILGKPNDS